jgi:hypothetical protein
MIGEQELEETLLKANVYARVLVIPELQALAGNFQSYGMLHSFHFCRIVYLLYLGPDLATFLLLAEIGTSLRIF